MQINAHGGGCCGVYHIFGFGNEPNTRAGRAYFQGAPIDGTNDTFTYLQGLQACLNAWDNYYREAEPTGGRRILEACLTDGQVRNWHQAMVDHGFKKLVRFRNQNSGNHVNIYMRHLSGFEIFDASEQIPQQVVPQFQPAAYEGPAPAVGALPAGITFDPVAGVLAWPNYQRNAPIQVGTLIQVNDPTVRKHGQIGTVRATGGETVPVDLEDGSHAVYYTHRLRPIYRFELAPQPAPEPVPEPLPPEPTVLFRQVFAHLRDGGRRGPFDNREAAVEAYPRCQRFEEQTIMTDGLVTWSDV